MLPDSLLVGGVCMGMRPRNIFTWIMLNYSPDSLELYLVIGYVKGFHTDNSSFLQQSFNFVALLKTWQQCSLPPPFYLQVNSVLSLCSRCESIHCMHYKVNTLKNVWLRYTVHKLFGRHTYNLTLIVSRSLAMSLQG